MRGPTWFIALVLHPVALSSRAKDGQSARQFGTWHSRSTRPGSRLAAKAKSRRLSFLAGVYSSRREDGCVFFEILDRAIPLRT
jgi:hypothetical protein